MQMPQLHPPIFLSVELSRSFLREYPVCGSQKNIVLPYPTVDSDFYSGALFQKDFPMHLPYKKRDKLIFYVCLSNGCMCVFRYIVAIYLLYVSLMLCSRGYVCMK